MIRPFRRLRIGGAPAGRRCLCCAASAYGCRRSWPPHNSCIFTFNVRDFLILAQRYPHHGGIILAAQSRWTVSDLIAALDRLLAETQAGGWRGQVRWLSRWRR